MIAYSLKNVVSFGLLLLFVFASVANQSHAQQCDHTIKPSTGLKIYDESKFIGLSPGQTICLEKGNYGTLRFTNIKGAPNNPITIRNSGGAVILDGSHVNYAVLQFNNSQYIHLTGAGERAIEYGIFIKQSRLNENNKSGLSGVAIGSLSSDFEIDHLEIQRTGFAGIVVKTDPKTKDCEKAETQATFRANFTLKNLHIHHNYIHNTGGEGMYIGSTWGFTRTSKKDVCNGYAHLLENVEISHNRIEQAGWDAMQVSLAHKNVKIHHNDIDGYGHYAAIEGEGNQSFGIALGGGTKALVYNNKIIQRPENTTSIQRGISGIDVLTGTKFFNNLIVGPGYTGIWVHLRYVENHILPDLKEDLGLHFFNNTIIKPGINNDTGLGIYVSTCQPKNQGDTGCRYGFDLRFINNIIVEPAFTLASAPGWMELEDVFIQMVTKEIRDSPNSHRKNNLYVRESPTAEQLNLGANGLDEVRFVDPSKNDYSLLADSIAVDDGLNLAMYGVVADIFGNPRPNGTSYDIGAVEHQTPLVMDEQDDILFMLPTILAKPKQTKANQVHGGQ